MSIIDRVFGAVAHALASLDDALDVWDPLLEDDDVFVWTAGQLQ